MPKKHGKRGGAAGVKAAQYKSSKHRKFYKAAQEFMFKANPAFYQMCRNLQAGDVIDWFGGKKHLCDFMRGDFSSSGIAQQIAELPTKELMDYLQYVVENTAAIGRPVGVIFINSNAGLLEATFAQHLAPYLSHKDMRTRKKNHGVLQLPGGNWLMATQIKQLDAESSYVHNDSNQLGVHLVANNRRAIALMGSKMRAIQASAWYVFLMHVRTASNSLYNMFKARACLPVREFLDTRPLMIIIGHFVPLEHYTSNWVDTLLYGNKHDVSAVVTIAQFERDRNSVALPRVISYDSIASDGQPNTINIWPNTLMSHLLQLDQLGELAPTSSFSLAENFGLSEETISHIMEAPNSELLINRLEIINRFKQCKNNIIFNMKSPGGNKSTKVKQLISVLIEFIDKSMEMTPARVLFFLENDDMFKTLKNIANFQDESNDKLVTTSLNRLKELLRSSDVFVKRKLLAFMSDQLGSHLLDICAREISLPEINMFFRMNAGKEIPSDARLSYKILTNSAIIQQGDLIDTPFLLDFNGFIQELVADDQMLSHLLSPTVNELRNCIILDGNECDACGRWDVVVMKCGKCNSAYYCSRTCQRDHWKTHKQWCF